MVEKLSLCLTFVFYSSTVIFVVSALLAYLPDSFFVSRSVKSYAFLKSTNIKITFLSLASVLFLIGLDGESILIKNSFLLITRCLKYVCSDCICRHVSDLLLMLQFFSKTHYSFYRKRCGFRIF